MLVANRGEIACRIIRTVQRLGARAIAVYSDADETALHVRQADAAIRIGPGAPAESYLRTEAILDAVAASGADAVHPGYGFLSERADFATAIETAGIAFVGPTPAQLEAFGAKHTARALAERAGVPLLPGSELLFDVDAAAASATAAGYPVVLKATAGGGGIGMRICADEAELRDAFAGTKRQAGAAFGDDGVYLERYLTRARHIEVQVFGDGLSRVIVLGDRDCSLQRRNQKVVEEAPAPRLSDALRGRLHDAARTLASSVDYRSAGTVEMLVDVDAEIVAFLEVNARLQVEHPVTEAVTGVDLVEWMLRLASGDRAWLDRTPDLIAPSGSAIEARVYAEDPGADYRPSAGLITAVSFPADARVDTWIEAGTTVSPTYDPMLAKVIVHAATRADAVEALGAALDATSIDGVATNLDQLRGIAADPGFGRGEVWTGALASVASTGTTVEVLTGGTLTTVQDLPGRIGLWPVGVPPSGPMDDRSFRLGNRVVGNPEETPALELTAQGPTLRFRAPTVICLAGAPTVADLDGTPVVMWTPVAVAAGATLTTGAIGPPGIRASLHVRGGFEVTDVLGSSSTFTLGGFGGHGGRALQPGDVLRIGPVVDLPSPAPLALELVPAITDTWQIGVVEGPHAAPEFLTADGLDALLAAEWQVHHNSARTGVRLVGPAPQWARTDGGDAGLHPSNIHDTPYAVGAVDLTGDMPIILGPDGPSLGGFVCPVTVVSAERWKIGQLRPGATVRLVPVSPTEANQLRSARGHAPASTTLLAARDPSGGVLDRWDADGERPAVCWRRSGDENLLVEYGAMTLDLVLRFRVHALQQWLEEHALDGVVEVTPGIRSAQVHVDPDRLSVDDAFAILQRAEGELPGLADVEVESRVVNLPLAWDDPSTREAIDRYMSTVRDDAPWCPWNIEFIRRINGLDDVSDVHRIVFDASYLVLGLGDVYLGAPVATPLDPRHRLVTTKYNPARTWTPENAVGIGGAYMCIYGMEGPGGYQFVGRTVPIWNRFRTTNTFEKPWLLRFFDQIRYFEVSPGELLEWRRDLPLGRVDLEITPTRLRLADHLEFLTDNAASIATFRDQQQSSFNAERTRWEASGEFDRAAATVEPEADREAFLGAAVVEAALHASVWQVGVEVGQAVSEGDVVVVLEAMKMETPVRAPVRGTVRAVLVRPGQEVRPGQPLVAIDTDATP